MWKSGFLALIAAAAAAPCMAQPSQFERGMNTMWEVLWHQSGTATRLARWEQDMKVRVHGTNLAAHRQNALQAIRDVAAEAGVKVVDVTDRPEAAQEANVTIEIVADTALSESQPCETRLSLQGETTIQSATMLMRNSDARRCAHHEAMHVMGVRGHPEGNTVLSYFEKHEQGLTRLDKAMLRGWYSSRTQAGMTPFEVLPVLADELISAMPDKAKARQERDRFLVRVFNEMHAFAEGAGDVPTIVKRSGKFSDNGIRYGRVEMSYFLGVAYQQGAIVPPDTAQATRWLQRAASLGSRNAQARLAATG